jgi:D-glycero-D-manno-heptose 1,7-bisphosphate phosphatase
MKRAVFLDRDGVINPMVYNPEHGVLDTPLNPKEFSLLPRVGEAIHAINQMEFLAVVISNQPGVAKGKMTLPLLNAITEKMLEEVEKSGAKLDKIFYCLHHPEAVLAEYRQICDCRKPKAGLLLKASQELGINLKLSYMIGDGVTDIQAGKEVGCKTIWIGKKKCETCEIFQDIKVNPDFTASNLLQAISFIS